MRIFAAICLLLLLGTSVIAQDADEDIPYIYYYSGALNGIVIERADGTDSRIIGQKLMGENELYPGDVGLTDLLFAYGPGWSPTGEWFAWRMESSPSIVTMVGSGYAVSADGQQTLDMLSAFSCIYWMGWHPTRDILLVYGTVGLGDRCYEAARYYPLMATYWLIDVNTQTRLATFSIDSDIPIYQVAWFEDEQYVQFMEYSGGYIDSPQYFLVTMSFDGQVTMDPFTRQDVDEWRERVQPVDTYDEREFCQIEHTKTDCNGRAMDPPPNSSSHGGGGGAVSVRWHATTNWAFVNYGHISEGGTLPWRANIMNAETGESREIADCGYHIGCMGFLPEQVDLDILPHGRPNSVLAKPISIDYTARGFDKYSYAWLSEIATHELVCRDYPHPQPDQLADVTNIGTGIVDYVLKEGEPCKVLIPGGEDRPPVLQTLPIVFALSPDEKYYAVTDGGSSSLEGTTALYDAKTGKRITTLNFYGIELRFTDDSRYLITTGRYATATWDIQALIANRLE